MTQTTHQYREEMQLRSVLMDNGERYYVLADIAKCLGYKAPDKFAMRCPFKKVKVEARWKTGIRCGTSYMWAVNYENYLVLAKTFEFPKEMTEFLRSIENSGYKKVQQPIHSLVPESVYSPVPELIPNPALNVGTRQTPVVNDKDIFTAIDNMMMALIELRKSLNA